MSNQRIKSFLEKMQKHLQGKIAYHQANLEVYFNSPAGIGEHPDIMEAIESELGKLAEAQEKLITLENLKITVW